MEKNIEKSSGSETLLQALQEQQANNKFCDVKINVDGQTFHAHKCVLAARSPVFSAMLLNQCVESTCGVIELKEIESEVFEKVLSFLYTQEIELDVENICSVLFFADMYQIKSLSKSCIVFMKEKLDVDNCIPILVAAKQCHLPVLIYASIQMMRNYLATDITDEFLQLSADHVNEILSNLGSFYGLETEVFCAVMRWLSYEPHRSVHISAVLSEFDLKSLRGDAVISEIINSEFMKHHQNERTKILTRLAMMCCSGVALSSNPTRPQKTFFFTYEVIPENLNDGKMTLIQFDFLQSNWFTGIQLDYRKFMVGVINRNITNEELRQDPYEFTPVRLRFQLELLHTEDPGRNLKSECFTFTFDRNQFMRSIPLELAFDTFMESFVEQGKCYFTLKVWGLDMR